VDDVRGVALARQGEPAGDRVDGDLDTVHEHEPAGGRRRRGEEERVVAPRPDAARGAGREPAEAVGLEPLGVVEG
jgi:hypothetical protein